MTAQAMRVRRDGFDHFNLQVMRSGRMSAGIPGEERWLPPGDVVLFDTSKPQRTVVQHADYVAVSLSRDLVEAVLPNGSCPLEWCSSAGAVTPCRAPSTAL